MERRRQTEDSDSALRWRALENDKQLYEEELHAYMDRCERHERTKRNHAAGKAARRQFAEDPTIEPAIPSDPMEEADWMDGWRGEEIKINNERARGLKR